MHTKLIKILAMVALLSIPTGFAFAGPGQIGLLDSSRYDDSKCIGAVLLPAPGSQSSCGSAKFGKCSSCDRLLIRNQSDAPVKLAIKITGPGFQREQSGGAIGAFMQCPSGASIAWHSGEDECGSSLEAKASCLLPIEFCPEQAGAVHGQVRASVTAGAGQPQVMRFPLVGNGDYSPDLAAADEALRRHLGELMKILYVSKVVLDDTGGDIAINVEVTRDDKIAQVRRSVPPKIEGYRTEVTTYSEVGYGL
jgi:hypothetical protein